MVDFASDVVVETYRKLEIKRKPYDPLGGGGQYYTKFQGQVTPTFDTLDKIKQHIDYLITEATARGDY